ncbi:hypothetical protein BgiBS90_018338 [Biomphalaria glabrata]|nr:hypothetical protein BgiBS90_018338 [Biomphalaria glabrata]
MASSGQKGVIDLTEICNLYATKVASKQIAGKPNLDHLKLSIVNPTWKEEERNSRAFNSDMNITFTIAKGQVKGFNKEQKLALPKGLPLIDFKFNPGQEKTENKVPAANSSGPAFTGHVILQAQLKGRVIFQDGATTDEADFAQMISDILDKGLPCPLSVKKNNQGLREYAEWTIEGHVKIQ